MGILRAQSPLIFSGWNQVFGSSEIKESIRKRFATYKEEPLGCGFMTWRESPRFHIKKGSFVVNLGFGWTTHVFDDCSTVGVTSMTLDSTEAAGIQTKTLVYADVCICLQSDHQEAGCRPFSEVLPEKTEDLGGVLFFLDACRTFMHSFPKVTPCGGDVQQRRSLEEVWINESTWRCIFSKRYLQNVATKMSNFYIKHPQKHLTNPTRTIWLTSLKISTKKRASNKTLAGSVQSKTWMRFGAAFGRRGR